jgi:hypothetical protein
MAAVSAAFVTAGVGLTEFDKYEADFSVLDETT